MRPEDFIREKLRKLFGDDVAKKFDEELAKGLPCELCGKTSTSVAVRLFERPIVGAKANTPQSLYYEATHAALPEGKKSESTFIVPSLDPALCDECYAICRGAAS